MHPPYLHEAIAETPRVAVYGTLKEARRPRNVMLRDLPFVA
jgi:hypothetical protein